MTTLLCLHGSGGHGRQWQAVAGSLPADWTVHAPTLAGYDGRLPDRRSYSMDTELACIGADGGPGTVLVGHSLGAAVALAAHLRSPGRYRAAVLVEPALFSLLDPRSDAAMCRRIDAALEAILRQVGLGRHLQAAEGFFEFWNMGAMWARLDEKQQARIGATMPKVALECGLVDYAGLRREAVAAGPQIPVLLVCGSQSAPQMRAIEACLLRLWPQTRLQLVTGAGHLLPVTHARELATLIASFVANLSGCHADRCAPTTSPAIAAGAAPAA